MKILLVDNDVDYTAIFTRRALLSHHEIEVCNLASTAVGKALSILPDVIIIDLFMPSKNGFQLAVDFRNFESLKRTKIVISSGLDYEHATLYSNILADSYIEKTGDIGNLLKTCEDLVRGAYKSSKK